MSWGARFMGDALIALPAALACAGSAGAGCAMAAAAAAAGLDAWQNLTPGSADELIKAWVFGICGGVSAVWEILINMTPQFGGCKL